jgi:molecular chaperone HscB
MQWSVRINEAYQRLKDPLKRAAYLCELHGVSVNAHDNTAMPADFLMQQVERREALDEAQDVAALDGLHDEVTRSRRALLQRCEQLLDGQQDYAGAVAQVRALMFIERFAQDIDARYENMESKLG